MVSTSTDGLQAKTGQRRRPYGYRGRPCAALALVIGEQLQGLATDADELRCHLTGQQPPLSELNHEWALDAITHLRQARRHLGHAADCLSPAED
jgi:hypothetical protein